MGEDSYDAESSKDIPSKISALRNITKSYEMKIRGFKLDSNNGKWLINSKALASSNVITQSVGVLSSFTEDINLITTKTMEKFIMEFTDAFFKINGVILNDEASPAITHRAVLKMFKDSMSNTGDIITGSRHMFSKVFDNERLLDNNRGAEY